MEPKITREIFPLTENGSLIHDIDTDQIFHNQYLSIVDINEMGQYALDNLDGYRDFAEKVRPGMIVIGGENFGSGSSRQQAVDCFRALGLYAISALSFGAIYKRNVINTGFPLIEILDIDKSVLTQGRKLTFDLDAGTITDPGTGSSVGTCKPMSDVQKDIIQNNGLLNTT